MFSKDPREWKKCEMNSVSQLEVMWPGVPCFENTWVRNIWASWGASTVSWVGMNSDCLVSLSTITRIAVNPSDMGSCSMKSIEIDSQGWAGIGSCLRSPYGLWCGALVCAQLVRDFIESLTMRLSPGQ